MDRRAGRLGWESRGTRGTGASRTGCTGCTEVTLYEDRSGVRTGLGTPRSRRPIATLSSACSDSQAGPSLPI